MKDKQLYVFCPLRNDYCTIECINSSVNLETKRVNCDYFAKGFPTFMLKDYERFDKE